MKSLNVLCLTIFSLSCLAQKDTALHTQKIDSETVVSLHQHDGDYFFVFQEFEKDSSKEIQFTAFHNDNPFISIDHISFQFLDAQTGYVFGSGISYRFYPFIYKTNDGGKTWYAQFFNKKGLSVPLTPDDFYMFDKKRGIVMVNWSDQPLFTYYITEDGGENGTRKETKIPNSTIGVLNVDPYMKNVFYRNGMVNTTLMNPDFKNQSNAKQVVLRSTDFGENFQILE